ncbi:MAG TPA: hypothetical protein DGT23_23780 [Micromonosporaceae bacterium]|nr:hypothetical protein [Micromonosporaceae bacterium]
MTDNPSMDHAIDRAAHTVRVHCAIAWPEGNRCLNCHRPHPCPTRESAVSVLLMAGWDHTKIVALDTRTSAWS